MDHVAPLRLPDQRVARSCLPPDLTRKGIPREHRVRHSPQCIDILKLARPAPPSAIESCHSCPFPVRGSRSVPILALFMSRAMPSESSICAISSASVLYLSEGDCDLLSLEPSSFRTFCIIRSYRRHGGRAAKTNHWQQRIILRTETPGSSRS